MKITSVLLLRAAVALTCSWAIAPAFSQSQDEELLARRLEGAWRVVVTQRDCATGAARPPFHSMLTFTRGGTLSGTTANPAFQPGQRSPDHGVWTFAGGHAFRAVDEAFILFDSPAQGSTPAFHRGTQRIDQTIELKNEDEFASTASTSLFDTAEKVLTKGCAVAVGRRLKLAP